MLMKTILKFSFLIVLFVANFAKAQDKAFLTKYAGTYHMLADGQSATATSDKYVLKPDGKATWTIFSTINPDGSTSNKPTINQGSWSASEGLIHLKFSGGDGGEMLNDFTLKDGVFRAEGVFLKKVAATAKK